MNVPVKARSISTEPHAVEPVRRGHRRSHFWLEWAAGLGAFALALAAMLLFMMNTIADRVDGLIDEQNAAALKLASNLQYFDAFHAQNDPPLPPGLFTDLVGFSRNTAIILEEVHRLLGLEYVSTFGMEGEKPGEQWSEKLPQTLKPQDGATATFDQPGVDPGGSPQTPVGLSKPGEQWSLLQTLKPKDGATTTFDHTGVNPGGSPQTVVGASKSGEQWPDRLLLSLKPKDGSTTIFDHTGVNPGATSATIVKEGNYQIELYQSLRDFWQEKCTSYKDVGGAISTYLFPLLYALLGAGLCDLRCRTRRAPGEPRRPASLGSARYTAAIIAGAVIGVFTSLIPTSLSLPPLLIAFLLGYSVDIFTTRLDALVDKLRAPGAAA
jgi:hypothetical protein